MEEYILDTLRCIETVRLFCDNRQTWATKRELELERMRDISFDYVTISKSKVKTLTQFMKKGRTQIKVSSKVEELEKELGSVLQDTLKGLEELQPFLEAVEKLAVTSLFVFKEDSILPMEVSDTDVRSVIYTAREVCPLLIHLKRDAGKFFLPNLCNVEVLICYLEKYLEVAQKLSEGMEKTCDGAAHEWKNGLTFNLNMSEESMQKLHEHCRQLIKIRLDQSFKLRFLFKLDAQNFMNLFKKQHKQMFKFLDDLEERAVKLDNMKKGSSISTVAGSSVGIVGGVLSIVGLALAPVTAGVSLSLTLAGVGLGVTSGVNSLVTGITEMAVNNHHGKNASSIFGSFMKNVQKLQDCLEQAASRKHPVEFQNGITAVGAGKIIFPTISVAKSVDAIVDAASAVKVLKSEEVARKAVNLGLQEAKAARGIPNLASDLPDIGQLAKGTPLALGKAARAGFITLNALFIGLDVVFICKESWSLAKGTKSEASQLIRSRSALWRTELEAWEKINEGLRQGISEFRKWEEILEKPFQP